MTAKRKTVRKHRHPAHPSPFAGALGATKMQIMLEDHLAHNFIPPIDRRFAPAAFQAIVACSQGDADSIVVLPNGKAMTAGAIVTELHLEQMVDQEREEVIPEGSSAGEARDILSRQAGKPCLCGKVEDVDPEGEVIEGVFHSPTRCRIQGGNPPEAGGHLYEVDDKGNVDYGACVECGAPCTDASGFCERCYEQVAEEGRETDPYYAVVDTETGRDVRKFLVRVDAVAKALELNGSAGTRYQVVDRNINSAKCPRCGNDYFDDGSGMCPKCHGSPNPRGAGGMFPPDWHQLQIVKKTLKYSDAGARIMGGMTKDQARELLRTKHGWSEERIRRFEENPPRSGRILCQSCDHWGIPDNGKCEACGAELPLEGRKDKCPRCRRRLKTLMDTRGWPVGLACSRCGYRANPIGRKGVCGNCAFWKFCGIEPGSIKFGKCSESHQAQGTYPSEIDGCEYFVDKEGEGHYRGNPPEEFPTLKELYPARRRCFLLDRERSAHGDGQSEVRGQYFLAVAVEGVAGKYQLHETLPAMSTAQAEGQIRVMNEAMGIGENDVERILASTMFKALIEVPFDERKEPDPRVATTGERAALDMGRFFVSYKQAGGGRDMDRISRAWRVAKNVRRPAHGGAMNPRGVVTPGEKLYTCEEAAGYLKYHPVSVRRLVGAGKLKPTTHVGKSMLFTKSALDHFRAHLNPPGDYEDCVQCGKRIPKGFELCQQCTIDLAEAGLPVEEARKLARSVRRQSPVRGQRLVETPPPKANPACGKCHACGTALSVVLDGEEWCPKCQTYRRYASHGFVRDVGDPESVSPCKVAAPRPVIDLSKGRMKRIPLDAEGQAVPDENPPSWMDDPGEE